ncbi:MAG: DUF4013 domain-containing protein [Anaerolineae bacterium]|jgi:hypothetical protein|nr:DUF4013 domain-containing protein [Anaerolineae bacterium]
MIAKIPMMTLRYALQGEGWFGRILMLTLLQLLPVIGQLLLIGYGMAIARSFKAGESGLPHLHWQQAAVDGLRFLLAGVMYTLPIWLMIPSMLSVGLTRTDQGDNGSIGFPVILISLFVSILIVPILRRLPARYQMVKSVILGAVMLVPLFMITSMIISVIRNPSLFDTSNAQLNITGAVLMGVIVLLGLMAITGLHISGLRDAQQGKGLFDPTGTIRLVIQHRGATAVLLINLITLMLIGGGVTALILPLILPAAFSLVMTIIAIWYTLADYGRKYL